MTPIRTERLLVRQWEERDRDLFFRINSDDRIMEFFPFRRTRAESDALLKRLKAEIDERGFGFSAVEICETGECIGFTGLHAVVDLPCLPSNSIEIGWRLAPEHWGRGYATEAAQAALAFGFRKIGLREIVSFAVWNNRRSTSVMERIGMQRDVDGDFDHPRVPDTHPHLKRHVLYRLDRDTWEKRGPGAVG